MTEPLGLDRSTDDGAVDAGVTRASRSESRRGRDHSSSSPHSGRFRTVTALLVALAIGAIVVAVSVAVSGRPTSRATTGNWSEWHPPEKGTLGARDIADFVAPFYRIDSVDQLAVITVVNLESASAAAAAQQAAANGTTSSTVASGLQVAVRPSPTSSQVSLLNGNTIAYNLCGQHSPDCAIGVGKPSANRLLLLRREALELALYTFKYIGGTQNVVAILPPGHAEAAATATLSKKPPHPAKTQPTSKPVDLAVLFVRPELSPLLQHPLKAILPEQVPPTVAEMKKAPEAGLVEQITGRGLFSEQLQQAQDGSSLIVLNPLPPQ